MTAPYLNEVYPFAVDLLGDEPEGVVVGRELSQLANQFERSARLFRQIEQAGWKNGAPRVVYNQDEYGAMTLLATKDFVTVMIQEGVLDEDIFETLPHELGFVEERVLEILLACNSLLSEEELREEVSSWSGDDFAKINPEWVLELLEVHVAEGGIPRVGGEYDFRITPY